MVVWNRLERGTGWKNLCPWKAIESSSFRSNSWRDQIGCRIDHTHVGPLFFWLGIFLIRFSSVHPITMLYLDKWMLDTSLRPWTISEHSWLKGYIAAWVDFQVLSTFVCTNTFLFTATMFPETANWLTPADEYVLIPITCIPKLTLLNKNHSRRY